MRNGLIVLMMYLVLFFSVFLLSAFHYLSATPAIDIGLPGQLSNLVIMVLSCLGVIKSAFHIVSYQE